MWQVNPGNFFGLHLSTNLLVLAAAFWAFSTLPTPFFCTSQHDPCSCVGGGFQIFRPLCNAATSSQEAIKELQSNATNSSGNGTSITTVPENTYVVVLHVHAISNCTPLTRTLSPLSSWCSPW